MAWIESHQTLLLHPKTGRVSRCLGVSKVTTIGHLHCLWWWALEHAQDGSLTKHSVEDIADGAQWEGDDPARFVKALTEAGFIDETSNGLCLHDWWEYAGRLIERRQANAERMRQSRSKGEEDSNKQTPVPSVPVPYKNVQGTCETRASHVQGLPYPTVPNQEEVVSNSRARAETPSPDPPPSRNTPRPAKKDRTRAETVRAVITKLPGVAGSTIQRDAVSSAVDLCIEAGIDPLLEAVACVAHKDDGRGRKAWGAEYLSWIRRAITFAEEDRTKRESLAAEGRGESPRRIWTLQESIEADEAAGRLSDERLQEKIKSGQLAREMEEASQANEAKRRRQEEAEAQRTAAIGGPHA